MTHRSQMTTPALQSARHRVQKVGTFLSGMIMPNIGAFIAWGLVTALFAEKGWTPVPALGGFGENTQGEPHTGLITPIITYLLPLLIGYTGGKAVYGTRGSAVGAIATMGAIAGAGTPMFIGAMIMGPLAAWSMKKLDALWGTKIKPGFEMLVNNFSAGIWGALLALLGFYAISPLVEGLTVGAGSAVQFLVDHGLLPLTAILIEPAKVLFLNNAINHGVLTPLATQQALEQGKSILFLLEANPGPGLGILLAFMLFGRGSARASAPGAALIHFFGGIYEIYFPYVLMKPALILAAIAGGATGIATLTVTKAGLLAPAAPGSIIALLAQASRDSYLGVVLSVVFATVVSFLIAAVLLRNSKDEGDLLAATGNAEQMKGKKLTSVGATAADPALNGAPIRSIVFACDAGMGSSAMGASVLRSKITEAGHPEVKVTNSAISSLTDTYDVVVVHRDLAPRARERTPSARMVTVDNFMNSPRYDEIVAALDSAAPSTQAQRELTPVGAPASAGARPGAQSSKPTTSAAAARGGCSATSVLQLGSIRLAGRARTQREAVDEAGELLRAAGAVRDDYVASMHTREQSVSTYMGNLLAIPHGTNDAKDGVLRSSLVFIRYNEPVDWKGSDVKFVIGVAGRDKEHVNMLAAIARVFQSPAQVQCLEDAKTAEDVMTIFEGVNT